MQDLRNEPVQDGFRQRVVVAAEQVLKKNGSVGPIELFAQIRVLNPVHLEAWRKGYTTHEVLEPFIQIGPAKKARALEVFREWCDQQGLRPVEASYVRRTPNGIAPLVITQKRDPEEEKFYRTHYTHGTLDEKKTKRIAAKLSKVPDLTVFEKVGDEGNCHECGVELAKGSLLTMEKKQALCLECADLDHLVFLPAGDATLSRRARKHSPLNAVVVRFSRSRNRYERQGVLIAAEALAKAEEECAADAGERMERRGKDAVKREREDVRLAEGMVKVILDRFPRCPMEEARAIALHATVRSSGRVGRSAAGRDLEPRAVDNAVIAHIRHEHTPYDSLLMEGVERLEARRVIRARVDEVLAAWKVQ